MCYHLVLLQKGLGNDLSFFTKVKRQGVYPFLKYEKRDQENGDNSQKNKTCVAFSNSNALRDRTTSSKKVSLSQFSS
ncbi:hypothetical protein RhiirA4_462602 [Rhizophagus irregularis]|uniref:Uncharacterized protein n=1 Tax=Rhizophagus irregularis TaxID=588596 RepID=A0A2I1GLA4_9GLOM|nr:hypothetical protein RhiirA4_462602 [Rhizophagus irregularis]